MMDTETFARVLYYSQAEYRHQDGWTAIPPEWREKFMSQAAHIQEQLRGVGFSLVQVPHGKAIMWADLGTGAVGSYVSDKGDGS